MTDTLIFQPSTERMSVWYDCGESFRGETYLIEEDLERIIDEELKKTLGYKKPSYQSSFCRSQETIYQIIGMIEKSNAQILKHVFGHLKYLTVNIKMRIKFECSTQNN